MGILTQNAVAQNFPNFDHSLLLETAPDTTANISFGDFDGDGHLDILLVKGRHWPRVDRVLLGDGSGGIRKAYNLSEIADRSYTGADCIPFAPYPATTIFAADMNKDGFIDLVVPHRDGGQSYVYLGSSAVGFPDTRRIPFGPPDATIRVAAVADFDGDGIPDIVTIDENKGVNIYFGQKDHTYSAGISLADSKVVPYALAVADLNNDGKTDIIVGHVGAPSTVFLNDGTGRVFKSISFGDAQGTVYGFAIGDFNEDGVPDIAAARSGATSVLYFGSHLNSRASVK